MSWDWKGTLGTICPGIATAIGTCVGGPLGPLAGMAVNTLCQKFGLEPTVGNAQSIAQKIQDGTLTDEDRAKLQEAELTHTEAMQKLANDAAQAQEQNRLTDEKIQADDSDSARKRQVSLKDRTPQNLTYMALAACVVLSAAIVTMAVKGIQPAVSLEDSIKSMVELFKNLCVMGFGFFLAGGQHLGATMDKLYNATPKDDTK